MQSWTLAVLFCFIAEATSAGYYKVIGPRVVRPNSEYHVAVSTQNTPLTTSVTVSIEGSSDIGRSYAIEQSLIVEPYTTRVARLQVGDIDPGLYRLTVRGKGGVNFQTSSLLDYKRKSYSVFVQTDKSVYKPGHKILFRAVVLNPQLKPAAEVRDQLLNIYISDGQGNKVKDWKNVQAPRGVFTGDLQLSKNPVLGNWNISVKVHRQVFNKTIQVANYVLPKFLIDIQAPKHLTFKENILVANIQSRYSYGKKVKGDATITIYPTINSGVIQPIFQNPVRKVIPIDGSATVQFDVAKELRLSNEYERNVIVDVVIEETLTGRRQNNSVEVFLHKYDYKVELIKTANYYKPGFKYTAFLKVSNHDGTPIADDKNLVTVRHGYSVDYEKYTEEFYKLSKNGIAELSFYPMKNPMNDTALRIEAKYNDLKEWYSPVPAAVSSSNTYLQATLETDRPIVNQDVEITVNCTEPLKYISYQIMGRGDIIVANSFQIDEKNEYRFRFTATHAMVPTAHLIVSYVRPDGELVADSLNIQIDGLLQNFIDIQINTVESRPDLDVDLTIRAQANSYIGLLAVDQNLGQLKSDYDILQNQVTEELKRYDVGEKSPYAMIVPDQKSQYFWKPGASNAKDIFYNSGAILLTNSYVNTFRPTLDDVYQRPVTYDGSTVKPDRGPGVFFNPVTRPPLAGPYAFSRIPRPVWDKPKVYLSQHIADTWLFTNFSAGFEGKTSVRRKIPSSINTWVITGFSLDPIHGLGLVSTPKKLKVSKSFVVSLELPHSVQRGETLAVPVVVYNNLFKEITAEVTLHNPEQKFEFAEVSNEVNATRKVELFRRKKVTVKPNSGTSVSFMITATRDGYTEIKVQAASTNLQDTVQKSLIVKAEGETQYYSKALLIDLRNSPNFKGNISFEIPRNVVQGSESIEVSVVGDLLGPTIINLESLIRLPTGCGEQNLVHFVPNVIILNYLRNTAQLTPTIQGDAISRLEMGYQEQLSYRRNDGSFSAFGQMDGEGSTWLTAFVALSFRQAQPYIYVGEDVITKALDWLKDSQAFNGSFVEKGPIIHQKLQGGNGKHVALTAFTVLAFLENQRYQSSYGNVVNKALDYIARNLNEQEDIYAIALASYVLQLSKHPSKQSAFYLLDSKAKTGNKMKWWARDVPKGEEKNPWHSLPNSIDIETTSYALLTFLEAGLVEDSLPVIQWLVSQESNLGGFTSSQDTVIGTFALYKLVSKLSQSSNMQVEYAYRKQETNHVNVNRDNAMIVQKFRIHNEARLVNVTAQGTGIAVFRISYQYNMNVTGPWPMFTLDPQVDKNSNQYHLQLSICTAFVHRNLTTYTDSNMAVMEVNFPSGFTADIDSLPSLEVSQNVKKVETKNGDTTVVLYFNNITRIEYCPTVSAFRTHKVARQKPVSVVVYDYYDTSRRARIFYRGRVSTLCDICRGEDCGDVCTSEPDTQIASESRENGGKGAASGMAPANWLCILVLMGILRR